MCEDDDDDGGGETRSHILVDGTDSLLISRVELILFPLPFFLSPCASGW